jgi:hypothetical protein
VESSGRLHGKLGSRIAHMESSGSVKWNLGRLGGNIGNDSVEISGRLHGKLRNTFAHMESSGSEVESSGLIMWKVRGR